MEMEPRDDRSPRDVAALLRLIGVLLLLAGAGVAYLGPVELYCFYFFTEGGRFHYPGFGFGSFMFANLAAQIAGYYIIAAILIPLGYGHLRLRGWVGPLVDALTHLWVVAGLPFIVAFLFVLLSSKDLPQVVALAFVVLLAVSYPGLPWLVRRFYHGSRVRDTLARCDPRPHWLDERSAPALALAIIYAVGIVVLHLLILLHGIVPLFGTWVTGLTGITLLDLAIWVLAVLIWGTLRCDVWAWWGGLVYVATMAASSVLTLARTTWPGLLGLLELPPAEVEILDGIPLRGGHLAAMVGLPLALLLVEIIAARRSLGVGGKPIEGAA
jgi:hypothetical protein